MMLCVTSVMIDSALLRDAGYSRRCVYWRYAYFFTTLFIPLRANFLRSLGRI